MVSPSPSIAPRLLASRPFTRLILTLILLALELQAGHESPAVATANSPLSLNTALAHGWAVQGKLRAGSQASRTADSEADDIVKASFANGELTLANVSDALHRALADAGHWPAVAAGDHTLRVPVGHGQEREIALRLPPDYDPTRPWPLLLLYHYSGGNGPGYLEHVVRLMGKKRAAGFILAAPTHYRQTTLDAPPPFTAEHPLMLRALRQVVHIDSDRVHVVGTSLGGYTAWTLAKIHADRFASVVSISAVYSPLADVAGMGEAMAPNLAHLPVLHAWGARDALAVPGFQGEGPDVGTMSELNRRFSPLIKAWGLPVLEHRDARQGHLGVAPPGRLLDEIFAHRRVHEPAEVEHRFRHLHQARAYWLEGVVWHGDAWREGRPSTPRRDPSTGELETRAEALGRVYLPLLGRLEGRIDGQTLHVDSDHLEELVVWLGQDTVDWSRPITILHRGRLVFSGSLRPDPLLALAQARRTGDLDRLRWVGVRLSNLEGSEPVAEPLTAMAELPVVPGAARSNSTTP